MYQLTKSTRYSGCAAKLGPGDLDKALCGLPYIADPNLIVGLEKADDAAVYRLTDELAIVQTVDFITPIVDDPYHFGMIAAANAISDVYAMGGKPITAMNVVCFPSKTMDISILKQILSGALAKMREAEVTLVGGHSVQDNELKYGLSVTGIIHPQRIVTKSGARVGDKLILTKPLGTGIISTALKGGLADSKTIAKLTSVLATLNKKASELMVSVDAHACSDITGFGLLGHACEMALNSEVAIEIYSSMVPFFSEAADFAKMGLNPEGMYAIKEFRSKMIDVAGKVDDWMLDILFDPQTSGGLLISVSPQVADTLLNKLRQAGYEEAAIVGAVANEPKGKIVLL
jgi:selenide,water dikinase